VSTRGAKHYLLLGCGKLIWSEVAGKGFEPKTGRLDETIPLSAEGLPYGSEPGPVGVSLADELDGQSAWKPSHDLRAGFKVEVNRERDLPSPPLPAWGALAAAQAQWVTAQRGGTGVLLTPLDWGKSDRGRELLQAWAEQGWSWAPLEEVLWKERSEEDRFVAMNGLWLRLTEPLGRLVVASSMEAALAVEAAAFVLERILEEGRSALAATWRGDEEPQSGWFTRQRLTRELLAALKKGQTRIRLGEASSPIFRFSSGAHRAFGSLTGLRVTIHLPQVPMHFWWDQLMEEGFLLSPEGELRTSGINWADRPTVVLDASDGETRPFNNYLKIRSFPATPLDPARLESTIQLARPVEERLPGIETQEKLWTVRQQLKALQGEPTGADASRRVEKVVPVELSPQLLSALEAVAAVPQAAEAPRFSTAESLPEPPIDSPPAEEATPPPAPPSEPFPRFRPDQVVLEFPHRAGQIRVLVDDEALPAHSVRPAGGAPAAAFVYQLEGIPVRHGAIVRVDFEPEFPRPGEAPRSRR
jgi:hypothetical protein